jgi:hypothetical protein
MWAGSRRVGIISRAPVPALRAGHIVGIGATARAVDAAIAQVLRVYGSVDQEPERDRMRPFIRP